jgi:hypothetical protein
MPDLSTQTDVLKGRDPVAKFVDGKFTLLFLATIAIRYTNTESNGRASTTYTLFKNSFN